MKTRMRCVCVCVCVCVSRGQETVGEVLEVNRSAFASTHDPRASTLMP